MTDPLHEIARPEELPSVDTLAEVLRRWAAGDASLDRVRAWAATKVDRHVLPDVPGDHPQAVLVEVLLQLASELPLLPADAPLLLALVTAPPEGRGAAWRAWYDHVDATAHARR